MAKENFEATDGLLHDVMRKQAGSVEKAVLEAVMNSVDAGADNVNITISEDNMTISDDGYGMTHKEIQQYFEKFGLKDDDIEDKEFGKFRMGRGQIFNFGVNVWTTRTSMLIVNLEEDETTVEVQGEEQTLDTSGLSYNHIDRTEYDVAPVEGCHIEVEFYDSLDDVDDTVNEIEALVEFIPWLHDVDVVINNVPITVDVTPWGESDTAYFMFGEEHETKKLRTYHNKTAIYNKGAFVKTESLVPVRSLVITKEELDVNFARNDIIDGDDVWKTVQDELVDKTKHYLIEKRDFSEREALWLLDEAMGDDALLQQIRTMPLFTDIKGNEWSLNELEEENISYTHIGNKAAEDLMDDVGVVMIDDQYEGKIEELIEESNILEYSEVLDDRNTFEMTVLDDESLSSKRRERLSIARWFLTYVGASSDVKAGFSKHANAWKDDKNTVYIHKGLLNEKKDVFLTEGLEEILQVAAHDGDTRQGRHHNLSFRRNYWNYSTNKAEAQLKLMNGTADYEHY